MRFSSSIVLGSVFLLVLAACGDDSTGTGGGGGGTTSATTGGTTSASTTAASTTTSASTSGSGGDGSGGDSSSTGEGGSTTSTSSQGGGTGAGGGTTGQGGSAGVCATTCADLTPPDAPCQDCLQTEAFNSCQSEGIACAQAAAGPNDSKGCVACIDYATGGFAGTLCESHVDLLNELIVCVCEACG